MPSRQSLQSARMYVSAIRIGTPSPMKMVFELADLIDESVRGVVSYGSILENADKWNHMSEKELEDLFDAASRGVSAGLSPAITQNGERINRFHQHEWQRERGSWARIPASAFGYTTNMGIPTKHV